LITQRAAGRRQRAAAEAHLLELREVHDRRLRGGIGARGVEGDRERALQRGILVAAHRGGACALGA
jgi:hypothetical protein